MDETRKCFTIVIALVKFVGTFPVAEKGNNFIFKWYSFRTLVSMVILLISLVHFVLRVCNQQWNYIFMFLDLTGFATQLYFINLSKHWSKIAKECDNIDFYMKSYVFPKYLKLKLQMICVFLMMVTIVVMVSLVFYMANEWQFKHSLNSLLVRSTDYDENGTIFHKTYVILLHGTEIAISFYTGILRCCGDTFIITVSAVLASRFQQIVRRISFLIENKIQNEFEWKQTRKDYQRLYAFLEKWNDVLGYLILIQLAANMYLLLLQIQLILSPTHGSKLVSIFYTLELVFRCMLICYYAGNVHAEGKKLVKLLLLTPPEVFNAEVNRFLIQIEHGQPALTGGGLFTIKHHIILQIFGCVLSHEIVLLQYNTS